MVKIKIKMEIQKIVLIKITSEFDKIGTSFIFYLDYMVTDVITSHGCDHLMDRKVIKIKQYIISKKVNF